MAALVSMSVFHREFQHRSPKDGCLEEGLPPFSTGC